MTTEETTIEYEEVEHRTKTEEWTKSNECGCEVEDDEQSVSFYRESGRTKNLDLDHGLVSSALHEARYNIEGYGGRTGAYHHKMVTVDLGSREFQDEFLKQLHSKIRATNEIPVFDPEETLDFHEGCYKKWLLDEHGLKVESETEERREFFDLLNAPIHAVGRWIDRNLGFFGCGFLAFVNAVIMGEIGGLALAGISFLVLWMLFYAVWLATE